MAESNRRLKIVVHVLEEFEKETVEIKTQNHINLCRTEILSG